MPSAISGSDLGATRTRPACALLVRTDVTCVAATAACTAAAAFATFARPACNAHCVLPRTPLHIARCCAGSCPYTSAHPAPARCCCAQAPMLLLHAVLLLSATAAAERDCCCYC
ncbi:unnamed protein product, partial [Closterium sp. NIES-54]